LLFKAFDHGADLVMEALSKHAGGHGDVLMGAVTTHDEALHRRLKDMTRLLGIGVSADDASLVLRGLQTMAIRLERSGVTGLDIARWLAGRSEVAEILHPALPGAAGHETWRRDFKGCNGVFSLLLSGPYAGHEDHFIDALRLFRIGASWGGVHSLVAPQTLGRNHARFGAAGTRLIRLSIGLEAVEDLTADLESGLDALRRIAMPTNEHRRPAAE
jgi:cystathionine beta-lyase